MSICVVFIPSLLLIVFCWVSSDPVNMASLQPEAEPTGLLTASPTTPSTMLATSTIFNDSLSRLGITLNHSWQPELAIDNFIHPILVRENWAPNPLLDAHWDDLQLALMLASQFLSPKTPLFDFWIRLTHADVARADNGSYVLGELEPSMSLASLTTTVLEGVAQVVRFYPLLHRNDNPEADAILACSGLCSTAHPTGFSCPTSCNVSQFQFRGI